MTSQNFDARYQLLKCVAVADGIRTHNALELVTGRVVMVHLVDAAGPDEVEGLQRRLGRLPQTEKARVLEIATLPAGFAVVTEFLQGMTNFPEWLAARVPDDSIELPSQIPPGASQFPALRNTAPTVGDRPAAAEEPTRSGPGETGDAITSAQEVSTVQLRRPVATSAAAMTPPVDVPTTAAPSIAPPPPPEPPRPGPSPLGDFTRMFGAGSAPPIPTAPVLLPPRPSAPPPPVQATVPVAPVPTLVPPPVAAPIAPTPPPAPPFVPPAPVAPPAAPAPPILREGEFTRMFRGGSSAPTPPATPARRIENIPSPFAGGPPAASPPPPPAVLPPALLVPHTPIPPARISPPLAPRPTGGSDDFFGAFPPVSALPPAAAPYSPPLQREPPSSPSPIGSSGRPAGLGASPLGVPPAAPSPGQPPMSRPPLSPPAAAASPLGGSPMGLGLPPLPPPPASAPMFPGGGGGAVSPLGAGRATPASQGGVYTELIKRSVTPPPVPVIEQKQAQVAPVKKKSIPLGLILILNAVLIFAIFLIAYFVFRPKPQLAGQADSAAADSAAAADSGRKKALVMPKAPTITKPTVPTVQKPTLPTVPKLK